MRPRSFFVVRAFCYVNPTPQSPVVPMPNSRIRVLLDLPVATVGTVAEKLIGLATMALLAKSYSPQLLGSYLLVLSVTSLFALLADLGTNRHLLRATSIEPDAAGRHLGEILSLRIPALLSALTLATLGVYVWQPSLLLTTAYVSIFVFGRELYYAFGAIMLALGNVRGRVLSGLSGPLLLLAAVYVGARQGLSFEAVMLLHAFAGVLMLALGWAVARPDLGPWRLHLDRNRVFALITISQPLFLLGLLEGGLARSGEVLIALLGDLESVAQYGLGYRVVEASRFVIRPLTMVLFPLLAATAASGNWNEYHKHVRQLAGLSAFIGVVIGIVLGTQAQVVLGYVFGTQYVAAAPLFRVFALAVPFVFLLTAELLLLISLHMERTAAKLMGIGLAVNLLVISLVIPQHGAYGAAWSITGVHVALCAALAVPIFVALRDRRRALSTGNGRVTQA